ncbi:hypothetical protein K432DRAFT_48951 [Lepidopterella palustris CBS 459.81]|uniref:Uncharacterized protein n=1 Tax=Lepidopterella palustris CBS 459.81 TaxID=1314670 RepID=A0A8E2EA60_9PEZI|nr:hypothetical protein K432DRAFT_48951 [Lepidopterella palustris CBS 459.81]
MKTVPTLCATATVVGASAVGLSFGRPESSLDPPNKRKAVPATVLDDRPMPSVSHTSTATDVALSFSSPLPLSTSGSSRVANPRSHDGRPPQRRIIRRMTSGDAAVQLHDAMNNGYTRANDHDLDDFDPSATLRSRPSWLKRLSTISTSTSRNSSPGPLSPSVNGSMAFSHDGSTTPIVVKRSPSPLPPNKLVKRASSLRINRDAPSQSPGSRLPTLRRPATSHQRSATLQQRSNIVEMPAEDSSSFEDRQLPSFADHGVQYTQFFSTKVSKDKISKKRSASGNPKAIKRIFPDDRHKPTLLLAKSVSTCSLEVDESSSQDGDSVYFISRPGTPVGMATFLSSNAHTSNSQQGVSTEHRMSEEATYEARARRSFSIGDLLSTASASRKSRTAKLVSAKLTRQSSKRVNSAPLLAMGTRHSVTSHGESGRPAKRRDVSDPTVFRREVYSSPARRGDEESGHEWPLIGSSPLPPLPQSDAAQLEGSPTASIHHQDSKPTPSAIPNHVPPSPTLVHTGGRPSRYSVAPSEQASTLVGSDNEARGVGSGDEDDTDFQSETVFDSLRTGATRSTSGARGPRIETIFDESPPQVSKSKVTALRDLLPKGTFRDQTMGSVAGNQSITEEEESVSTPVRTVVPERGENESPGAARVNGNPLFPSVIPSSPPDMPKPLNLGTLEWDTVAEEDDSRWSFDEEDEEDIWTDNHDHILATQIATPLSLKRSNPHILSSASGPKPLTPQHPHHLTTEPSDRDTRSSIFDWSEQQPADKSPGNRTPPRPRTVHGKKDADGRGSRSVGRRAPSALHARSQSVPVVPDVAGKRNTVVTNKFGTWGVGSKGVTEDWNDDFEFTDCTDCPVVQGDAQRVDSGMSMFVPKTIQEQQSNVLANIGLLREWGLLIEELKEQRIRAVSLGLLEGSNASMWEEVDAMIDLADQEAEEEHVPPRLSPPSSPGFDLDAFDDVSGPSPSDGRGRRRSSLLAKDEDAHSLPHPIPQNLSRPRRKSILPPNHDIFGPQSSPLPSTAEHISQPTPPISILPTTRPRKDSEAKARSVIEALQKRKSTNEPLAKLQPVPPTKKVPFDTATLRHIVPYVNTLVRKVKDAVREAEGLYSSPSTSPKEPPFSKIFQTENDLSAQMKLMTVI